jgi:hypothetical protein
MQTPRKRVDRTMDEQNVYTNKKAKEIKDVERLQKERRYRDFPWQCI